MLLRVLLLTQVALGGIEGRVVSGDDASPIAGALVEIREIERSTRTDGDGRFRVDSVPAGRWSVAVTAEGHEPRRVTAHVSDATVTRIDIALASRTPRTPDRTIRGRVVDAVTGDGVPFAEIRLAGRGDIVRADRSGRFTLPAADPGVRVRVWAFGFEARDTALSMDPVRPAVVPLRSRPFELDPLTIVVGRAPAGAAADRALFDREPRPGVVGISQRELRDLPFTVERDLLRTLQALPGVVQVNDLSARLYVRGGAPDQNAFLLDDARIFTPYNTFGIFGAINPDAVRRVEFYRGSMPARYGGALSSVIDVKQRTDATRPVEVDAGLGLLATRATARGVVPGVQGRWILAARRSLTDVVLERLGLVPSGAAPFTFSDAQGQIAVEPAPGHRVRGSFYTSDDDFRMFLEGASAQLVSVGGNDVASLRWDWTADDAWRLTVGARHSGYGSSLAIGTGESAPKTTNALRVRGARLELIRTGRRTGLRLGADIEAGFARVVGGDRPGGYVEGASRRDYAWSTLYAEAEQRWAAARLAPGIRIVRDRDRGSVLVEPRLASRIRLADALHVSAALTRAHQAFTTLRDDRYPLPGLPLWTLQPDSAPPSRGDMLEVALSGWIDDLWSFDIAAYGRRFANIPVWRPTGRRTVDRIRYDAGRSIGAELLLRRHRPPLRGWIGYTFGRAELTGPDGEYFAPWDRRHAVQLAVSYDATDRLTVSARVAYGGGLPFWPQVGVGEAKWFNPKPGEIMGRDEFPLWGERQLRFPAYFRADLGTRMDFSLAGARVEPYASVINLTGRPNVLYYEYVVETVDGTPDGPRNDRLVPSTQMPFTILPSVGIDIRF